MSTWTAEVVTIDKGDLLVEVVRRNEAGEALAVDAEITVPDTDEGRATVALMVAAPDSLTVAQSILDVESARLAYPASGRAASAPTSGEWAALVRLARAALEASKKLPGETT